MDSYVTHPWAEAALFILKQQNDFSSSVIQLKKTDGAGPLKHGAQTNILGFIALRSSQTFLKQM